MARDNRKCNVGYSCGGTCISKKKVCLKKLGSNRALEVMRRFVQVIKRADIQVDTEQQPDLVADV